MNFYKDNIAYASPFLDPVDPVNDNIPDYDNIVRYPMDLVQIHNRLLNGYYNHPSSFWKDLGFIFKNCQLYNSNSESDIRIMCDTLR